MTYLIFGSMGYVSSNLIKHLKKTKNDYVNLSIRGNYKKNSLNFKLNYIFNEYINNGEKSCDLMINEFVENFRERFPNKMIQISLVPTGYCHKLKPNKSRIVKYNFHLPYLYSLISLKLEARKLIYISSAGIFSKNIQPIENKHFINPKNDYLLTKYLTELKIENYLSNNKNIKTKLFILRPTIIYGKSTKGSFRLLEKMVEYNIPIPLKNNRTKKSLLYIDNLIRFIEKIYYCEKSDLEAVNKILVTDDQTVTIEQIINWLSKKYNKKARIIKFNKYLISILKIIFPIYSLFYKLNSDLTYKKSELDPKLHISMSSKILKDLNEI